MQSIDLDIKICRRGSRNRREHRRADGLPCPFDDGGRTRQARLEGGRRIEDSITAIVIDILVTAEQQLREAAIHNHQWLLKRRQEEIQAAQQREIEAERKAKERREREERERIERLLDEANSLRQADAIRAYVDAIRGRLPDLPVAREKIEQWAEWALAQADRIDPAKSLAFLEGHGAD